MIAPSWSPQSEWNVFVPVEEFRGFLQYQPMNPGKPTLKIGYGLFQIIMPLNDL
jgi:hypothetical protein